MEAFNKWLRKRDNVNESRMRDREQLRGLGLNPKGMTIGKATKYDAADTPEGEETGPWTGKHSDDDETHKHASNIRAVLAQHGYDIDHETAYGIAQTHGKNSVPGVKGPMKGGSYVSYPGLRSGQPGPFQPDSFQSQDDIHRDVSSKITRSKELTGNAERLRKGRKGQEEDDD